MHSSTLFISADEVINVREADWVRLATYHEGVLINIKVPGVIEKTLSIKKEGKNVFILLLLLLFILVQL